jgi:UDP-N-acetylglucosamine 2-epimerase (non-hydrolysing)
MRPCIFVIGTRAQLVKMAPVLRLSVDEQLPHTVWLAGQHSQAIDELFVDLRLRSPIAAFSFRRENSSILKLASWMPRATLACAKYVRLESKRSGKTPLVIVHGDTASTLVGALAGTVAGGEVVHLESGLSSGALLDPFPEEIVRRLTFMLTRLALCPNADACDRMRKYARCRVVNTEENTLLDCVRYALAGSRNDPLLVAESYFVASIHRFQNIYQRSNLRKIVDELVAVSKVGKVYFVLHPPTRLRLKKLGLWRELQAARGISLLERAPFSQFLRLLAGARGVFSDGGSNQEELSYLGVPTVLFRNRSERPDGLRANVILRSDIRSSLTEFISSGELDSLRSPSKIDVDSEPSRIAVEALCHRASGQ